MARVNETVSLAVLMVNLESVEQDRLRAQPQSLPAAGTVNYGSIACGRRATVRIGSLMRKRCHDERRQSRDSCGVDR